MTINKSDGGQTDDLLHKIAIIAVAAYSWQLHGWLIGLLTLVSVLALVVITNIVIIANAPEKVVFRLLRASRWGWVLASAVFIAL